MIKAFIFDMDGLMIDSEMISYRCYRDVLKNYGINLTIEEYKNNFPGKQIPVAYEYIKNKYYIDIDPFEKLKEFQELQHYYIAKYGVELKKGLLELLNYLKSKNYKTAIATSSNPERVEELLGNYNILSSFNEMAYGTEVKRSKPYPDVFLAACTKLKSKPEECIVLEDSEAGIEAAFRAHIPVICIPDLKYPDLEYQKKTIAILPSLDKVIDFIENEIKK